jgi:hypothetical protein
MGDRIRWSKMNGRRGDQRCHPKMKGRQWAIECAGQNIKRWHGGWVHRPEYERGAIDERASRQWAKQCASRIRQKDIVAIGDTICRQKYSTKGRRGNGRSNAPAVSYAHWHAYKTSGDLYRFYLFKSRLSFT